MVAQVLVPKSRQLLAKAPRQYDYLSFQVEISTGTKRQEVYGFQLRGATFQAIKSDITSGARPYTEFAPYRLMLRKAKATQLLQVETETIEHTLNEVENKIEDRILPSRKEIHVLVEEEMRGGPLSERAREIGVKYDELAGKHLELMAGKQIAYINKIWPELLEKYPDKWAVIFPDRYLITDSEDEAYKMRRQYNGPLIVPSVVRKIEGDLHIRDITEIWPGFAIRPRT